MKIRYIGPHDEVVVPALGDRVVKRGGECEAPQAIADSLVSQGTWERVSEVAQKGIKNG